MVLPLNFSITSRARSVSVVYVATFPCFTIEMSASLSSSVLETNPYEGHPSLSELEAEVLWQYAKLSQNIKEVRLSSHHISVVALKRFLLQLISETRRVSEAPDEKMLKQLRALEVKMGLVLTLVRVSTDDGVSPETCFDNARTQSNSSGPQSGP